MKTALITLSFCLFFYTSATAINEYQYPQKNLSDKLCSTLINNLDDSSFPYSKKKPFRVKIDLQIEDIHKISGKNLDFQTSYSFWAHWKDHNVIDVLKKLNVYTNKGKPFYLCDYSPNKIIGENRRIFEY